MLTDDRHLVERARAGDADAFGMLFEQFHAPILNYRTGWSPIVRWRRI